MNNIKLFYNNFPPNMHNSNYYNYFFAQTVFQVVKYIFEIKVKLLLKKPGYTVSIFGILFNLLCLYGSNHQ